jgi:outer membrane protein OmpA-like peptidoglycan-associated protein
MKHLKIILPVLISLLFLFSEADSGDCKQAVELYNQGTVSNDFSEKERLFKEAIPLCSDPEVLSRVYNNMGDAQEKMGNYSKALVYYRKAIEIKKDLATPYISVGDTFFKLGDYYSAFIMYQKGLQYKPEDEDGLKGKEKSEVAFRKKMVIYFDLDSAKISDLYIYRLHLIKDAIKNNASKVKVEVMGYTCDLGSTAYNKRLSKRRAEAVTKYLEKDSSVQKKTIILKGRGQDAPLLPNQDDESRTLNRRVEIKIVELF